MKRTVRDHLALQRRHHEAWRALNRADDTHDGREALRALAEACDQATALLRDLGHADPDALLDVAEHAALARIRERLADLKRAGRGERFIHDTELAGLLNRAVPAVWRMIHEAEVLLDRQRPVLALVRSFALFVASLGFIAALWAAHWAIRQHGADGLRVTYYRDTTFTRVAARRLEPALVKDYGEGRPALGLPRDGWSARWEAVLHVPADGAYAFYAQARDGFRVKLDGATLMENLASADWNTGARRANVNLTRGDHRLEVEHLNARGPAAVRVRWTGGGIPPNTVIGTPYVSRPPED